MTKFKQDLKTGHCGETQVFEVFAKHGVECGLNTCSDALQEWDLRFAFEGHERTIELKFELYEAKSGNVAIEYFNPRREKLSGILATKADLWAFVLADKTVWLCRTKDLLRCFKTSKAVNDVANGGDGNASMRLYRRDRLFDQCFFRVDDMDREEFLSTLGVMLGV